MNHFFLICIMGNFQSDALHNATIDGDIQKCRMILRYADVDAKNSHGYAPLHLAAMYGQLEVCHMLISHGADVNSTDNCKFTPLHHAVMGKYINICRLLINNGADVNAKAKYGYTPLVDAVRDNNIEIYKLLINHSADVHVKFEGPEKTLLGVAYSMNTSTEIINLLKK